MADSSHPFLIVLCGCHGNCQPQPLDAFLCSPHLHYRSMQWPLLAPARGLAELNDLQERQTYSAISQTWQLWGRHMQETWQSRAAENIPHTDTSGWVRGNNALWVCPSLIHWRSAQYERVTIKGNCTHGYNMHIPSGFTIALDLLCQLMFVILWLTETPAVLTVPMCHPFPGGETQQNGEIVLLLPPFTPPHPISLN